MKKYECTVPHHYQTVIDMYLIPPKILLHENKFSYLVEFFLLLRDEEPYSK